MSNYIDLSYQPIAKQEIEILKKDYQNRILNVTDLANDTQRPNQVDVFGTKNLTGLGNYANYNYVNLTDLFFCWRLSDVCMTISQALKRKVFKGGIQITPNIENSSPRQEEMLKYICKCANKDNETLREVLEEIYDDLNWCDKGVMLKIKRYLFNSSNEIIGSNLLQVLRINPINFLEVRDEESNKLGYKGDKKAYVNINDRKSLCYEPIDKKTRLPNLPVHYEVIGSDGSYYYNKSEIVYKNKFKKGGFSPLYASYNKIVSLIEMDYFIRKEYGEGKPSKKMLAFKTPNRETTQEALNDYMESVKKNPNGIHPLNLQVTENKGSIAEVIDFMKPLTEMEFSETRQLFITQIGAPYGVSPMFMNDMSTGGGLNNEGLQITVTNEAVDSDKNLIIEYYLQDIKDELGCFDWDLSLLPSEEKDLVWTEDLFQKQLLNAEKYSSLGGKVKYDNGDFIYTEGYLEKKEENNFNNFNLDNNVNNDLDNIDTNKNLKSGVMLVDDLIDALDKEFENNIKNEE